MTTEDKAREILEYMKLYISPKNDKLIKKIEKEIIKQISNIIDND